MSLPTDAELQQSVSDMTEEELDKNYGQSGRSCRSIRDGYQQGCDHLKECVQWVESKL